MFNVENKTTQITEAVAVETVVRCTEIDVNGNLNNAKFVEYCSFSSLVSNRGLTRPGESGDCFG